MLVKRGECDVEGRREGGREVGRSAVWRGRGAESSRWLTTQVYHRSWMLCHVSAVVKRGTAAKSSTIEENRGILSIPKRKNGNVV